MLIWIVSFQIRFQGQYIWSTFLFLVFSMKCFGKYWFKPWHFLPRELINLCLLQAVRASQVAQLVKNPPDNAGDVRDMGLTSGWERSPGGGHSNPLQYSCLENTVDRGAWWAMVHRVTKSRTHWSDFACTHAQTHNRHRIYFHHSYH